MGTRIQNSRPTKRPQAVLAADGTPTTYSKRGTGKPRADKKAYPLTAGIPWPTQVTAAETPPATPGGGTALGATWVRVAAPSSANGSIHFNPDTGVWTISDRDSAGTSVAVPLENMSPGTQLWVGGPFGAFYATVVSVTAGASTAPTQVLTTDFVVTGEIFIGDVIRLANGVAAPGTVEAEPEAEAVEHKAKTKKPKNQ